MAGRDGDVLVSMTVKPVLSDGSPPRGYFVVLFEERAAAVPPDSGRSLASPASSGSTYTDDELVRVREQLRVTVEQYETESEDAKSANEELQAINEELRSTAEELETSKEELQSVNEELTTVNQELRIKIEELGLTNNDFQNLISATEIGTIFLDRSLRVKLSTPRAQDVFNLLPSDTGRKLTDINSTLDYATLHDDVMQVLARLQTIEREVPARDGRWYALRLLPYRTLDDRIDGVALTLQDITSRREVEQRAKRQEERLRLLVESAVDYAIFTTRGDGNIDSWSSGAERMFGYTAADIVGQKLDVLFTPEDRNSDVPRRELETARTRGRAEDERWHLRKDGSRFYCSGVTTALAEGQGFAKIARDLTSQRRAEVALQKVHGELEERVQQRTVELRAEVSQHANAQERVTALLRKLVTAQEDERARVARDLHDQLGQQLTALRLALERHRARMATTEGDDDIEHAVNLARELDVAVDFLAWELRPAVLDDLGLAAALPRYVEEWSAHYGVAGQFRAEGFAAGMLSREAEVVFYRIAQEALTNVLKHAHAARVDILLEARDHWVVMVVEDDGIGFDQADRRLLDAGIGLAGMRERAALIGAALDVESAPGKGTAVFVRRPLGMGAEEPV
jgi:PAS domain S-box-containing protein